MAEINTVDGGERATDPLNGYASESKKKTNKYETDYERPFFFSTRFRIGGTVIKYPFSPVLPYRRRIPLVPCRTIPFSRVQFGLYFVIMKYSLSVRIKRVTGMTYSGVPGRDGVRARATILTGDVCVHTGRTSRRISAGAVSRRSGVPAARVLRSEGVFFFVFFFFFLLLLFRSLISVRNSDFERKYYDPRPRERGTP